MADSKIKILIVSRTPWNEANSFGNTFSNLFGGMENVEIANICCQEGAMNSKIINSAFQLTDKDVAISILGFSAGRIIKNNPEQHLYNSTPKVPRKTFFYIMREAIWAIGRWKSKSLRKFIKDFDPDMLYIPIYRSHYMCEIDKFVIKIVGTPYVVHITDDIYGYQPNADFFANQLQRIIRRDIRQIVSGANYGEVFSTLMAKEYRKIFKIPFHVIGKSVDSQQLTKIPDKHIGTPVRFVYTGNFGGERGHQLVQLSKSILKVFPRNAAILDIYSNTAPDEVIQKELENIEIVNLKGSQSSKSIFATQQQADYLVHVEGFTPPAIFESRMSFSTKIIDYLLAGRPIVAFGPIEVTSIQVLKTHRLAHIALNLQELENMLTDIMEGSINNERVVNNGRNYLLTHRDSRKLQAEMYRRFQLIIAKK